MYQVRRVFCATAWELEAERWSFHDVVGDVNEKEAMKVGLLYAPVSLHEMRDKRRFQYAVDQNIREARHYILAVGDDWGPPEMNFERDYRLAVKCAADPAMPMSQTRILLRRRPDGAPSPFGAVLTEAGFPHIDFDGVEEFSRIVRDLLCEWIADDAAPASAAQV